MRRVFGLFAALIFAFTMTGCGKSGASDKPVSERLAAAASNLESTSGVRVDLHTEDLPKGVNGLISAKGVGTADPAFEGDIQIVTDGLSAGSPIVAVDGKVYINLGSWKSIDVSDFGAPDPALLFGTSGGLAGLFSQVSDATAGKDVRRGDKIYSTITGTIPGDSVHALVPGAANSPFKATFLLDESDVVSRMVITGPFYPKAGSDNTYTIDLSEYGTTATIAKP